MAKRIDVVGAVMERAGTILCAQRGSGGPLAGTWEFPGGKIEPGESPADALRREIEEELRCLVSVGHKVVTTTYDYEFGTVVLTTYHCEIVSGEPQALEHARIEWLTREELRELDWAPADVPAVEAICSGRA